MLKMWKLREISDKVTNVVMNYSEVEAKVREATNDDAWGPHGALMQEVAQYTFTYEHFPEVMGMLWKRMLHDNKKNWRRVYKSLLLLNYLVRNGSERAVTSAREHIYDLRALETYTFTDELGKDQGINVRQKVKDLMDLIKDDDRLREERKKAKKNKDKYIGMSGETNNYGGYNTSPSDRYSEEPTSYKSKAEGNLDEIDDWDKGKKSVAQEVLGKAKEIWNKTRGFDEPPDYGTNDDDLFEEDSPPNRYKEFRDDESEEYTSVERTHTTRTEKITTARKSRSKKLDLGAAAGYGKDGDTQSQSSAHSDITGTTFGEIAKPVSPPQDLLADFGEPASPTADSFADFNPRQSSSSATNANGDFGDFSQFQSATASSPKSGDDFADFTSFQSEAQKSPTDGTFGDFATGPSPLSSNNSAALSDLMSAPLQSNTQNMSLPVLGSHNMGQQPMGMGVMGSMPVSGQSTTMGTQAMTGMQTQMGMNMGMNMQSPTGQVPPGGMGQMGMNMMAPNMMQNQMASMQGSMTQQGMGMNSANLMGMGANSVGMMGQQPMMSMSSSSNGSSSSSKPQKSFTSTSVTSSTANQKNTWSNSGSLDISLDNLSPASKFQKHNAPTMNQLSHAPVPNMQMPGAMYQQGQSGQMGMMGQTPGMQGVTTQMGQMNMGVGATQPMMQPGMGMAMQGNMGMQPRMMGMPQMQPGMMGQSFQN